MLTADGRKVTVSRLRLHLQKMLPLGDGDGDGLGAGRGAELTLRQDDLFFNRDWCAKGFPRPKNWQSRIDAHRNAKVTFFYEKTPDFWHPAKGRLLPGFGGR